MDHGVERRVLLLDGGDGGLGQLAWFDLSSRTRAAWAVASSSSKRLFYSFPASSTRLGAPARLCRVGGWRGLGRRHRRREGIGLALATELRQRGAEVVTLDINPDGVDHQCDVSDADQVEAVFDDIDIDGLVNNAALLVGRRFEDIPLDEWERMLAVNVTGTFLCTRAASSRMPRGGSIVNLASETAFTGSFGFVHSRGVQGRGGVDVAGPRPRARPRNIRVNTVAPGFTPETAGRACWAWRRRTT